MTDAGAAAARPQVARITTAEVTEALRRGVGDFARAPAFGLVSAGLHGDRGR